MKNYRIVVMTYKRKKFKALHLLEKDQNVELYLAVRREEYEAGFYDEKQFRHPRIHFMLLDNVIDAGDTRQKIIDMCYNEGVRYCIELDDSTSRLYNPKDESMTITECVEKSIEELENDTHSDKIVAVQYCKKQQSKIHYHYHSSTVQAFLIDTKKLIELTNVRYRPCRDVGFDDACFSYELHFNGWAAIKSKYCFRSCRDWSPVVMKKGGTHSSSFMGFDHQVERNNQRHLQLVEFLHNTYRLNNIFLRTYHRTIKDKTYSYLSVRYEWDDDKILNGGYLK